VALGFGKTEPSTHVVAIPKLVAEEAQQAKKELDTVNLEDAAHSTGYPVVICKLA
jgi:hypothetical protein